MYMCLALEYTATLMCVAVTCKCALHSNTRDSRIHVTHVNVCLYLGGGLGAGTSDTTNEKKEYTWKRALDLTFRDVSMHGKRRVTCETCDERLECLTHIPPLCWSYLRCPSRVRQRGTDSTVRHVMRDSSVCTSLPHSARAPQIWPTQGMYMCTFAHVHIEVHAGVYIYIDRSIDRCICIYMYM